MGLLKDNSIIHTAALADLTAFTYTQVYSSGALSPTINGVVVIMTAGLVLDIRVRDISPTAGVFVIGSPIDTLKANQNL